MRDNALQEREEDGKGGRNIFEELGREGEMKERRKKARSKELMKTKSKGRVKTGIEGGRKEGRKEGKKPRRKEAIAVSPPEGKLRERNRPEYVPSMTNSTTDGIMEGIKGKKQAHLTTQ